MTEVVNGRHGLDQRLPRSRPTDVQVPDDLAPGLYQIQRGRAEHHRHRGLRRRAAARTSSSQRAAAADGALRDRRPRRIIAREETSPGWCGSDEVGLHTGRRLRTFFADGSDRRTEPHAAEEQTFKDIQDVDFDSGTTATSRGTCSRTTSRSSACLLVVLGDEIDSQRAYDRPGHEPMGLLRGPREGPAAVHQEAVGAGRRGPAQELFVDEGHRRDRRRHRCGDPGIDLIVSPGGRRPIRSSGTRSRCPSPTSRPSPAPTPRHRTQDVLDDERHRRQREQDDSAGQTAARVSRDTRIRLRRRGQPVRDHLPGRTRSSSRLKGCGGYLLHPFFVSSNPSNRRPAFAPASVSSRWGWPFSTV